MSYPEIRIKSSFLLNGIVVPLLKPELQEAGRQDEADDGFLMNKAKEYVAIWKPYEQTVMGAMTRVLDLEFKQNVIDVYVAPFKNSFSDPMVISSRYAEGRFVDVLTHELTHRLLTDNTRLPLHTGRKLSSYWAELFGDGHTFRTLVHIPVHAVLEYVYIDVLHEPERLERDQGIREPSGDYDMAWKYVKENGYMSILGQLKDLYRTF